MRVLFLSPRHPWPPNTGDRRRVLHFLTGLAHHADVTLACFGSGPPIEGVRVESVVHRLRGAIRANLTRPDPRTPVQVRLYLDIGMRQLVDRELEDSEFDVVHATLTRMAPYLPSRRNGCHRHLDLVDSLSLNMQSRADASAGLARLGARVEAGLLRGFEARAAAAADSCSLASEADRRVTPGLEQSSVIGNGVDLDALPFRAPEDDPGPLLFFGNLGYFHNVEPARFGAREVLPRVRRERPRTQLRVAGARPTRAVSELDRLPGVTVVGPVDDMGSELRHAGVALLPMFSGSGVKNKVLEAFCSGTPVVTNRMGVQGLEGAREGTHYLGGETASELAEASLRLLADPALCRSLAHDAHELVQRGFSWDRKVEALLELYETGLALGQQPTAA